MLFIVLHNFHRVLQMTHLHKHVLQRCDGHSVGDNLQPGQVSIKLGEEVLELGRVIIGNLQCDLGLNLTEFLDFAPQSKVTVGEDLVVVLGAIF